MLSLLSSAMRSFIVVDDALLVKSLLAGFWATSCMRWSEFSCAFLAMLRQLACRRMFGGAMPLGTGSCSVGVGLIQPMIVCMLLFNAVSMSFVCVFAIHSYR